MILGWYDVEITDTVQEYGTSHFACALNLAMRRLSPKLFSIFGSCLRSRERELYFPDFFINEIQRIFLIEELLLCGTI